MRRRRFLELTSLGILGGLTSPRLTFGAEADGSASNALADSQEAADTFGSGHFGEWIRDAHNLPAYRYTCNQTIDPKAVLPVNKAWRSDTDHIHQMGNDRLVAVVSNYGYVQVRQDEGSPKFLNDYFPEENRYGGGIGFLADQDCVLGTYYTGKAQAFERIFGAGYLRKRVSAHQYEVDQIIFAPYGDDPVLVSQVTITNQSSQTRRPRWVEYWGCHQYQLSYRLLMEGAVQGSADATPQLRRAFGGRFTHRFQQVRDGAGLVDTQSFPDQPPASQEAWKRVQDSLRSDPNGFYGGPVPPLPRGAQMEDLRPPQTFLISLDAHVDGYSTNASRFFKGQMESPQGIAFPLDNDLGTTGPESAFLLERHLALKPGESRTLYFLYGYLPEGFSLDGLVGKYAAEPLMLWPQSCSRWKNNGAQFRAPSERWIEREIDWNGGVLRGGLTYDSYFREHILSQGAGYQYLAGLQGAARDPLQHALPLVYSSPDVVRGILRYTLKEVQLDGSIPYGIVGSGVPMPCRYRPSDLQLWVLWLTAEYVLATRDAAFLHQRIPPDPSRAAGSSDPTVLDLLDRCFTFLMVHQGTGKHGLLRISNGDWNDSIVVNRLNPEQVAEATQHGESVLNAAMACYVFDYYARLLDSIGEGARAAAARAAAESQRQAVRGQWTGKWFRRAWLGQGIGWNGEKQLWLEPQPWAIIGGATTPEQRSALVEAIDTMSRKPSPIGAMMQSPADPTMKDEPGTGTNGGIFAAINATLIWALALADGKLAWDEWKKNTLAFHANVYPNQWFGIWSGPDAYNSVLAKDPGGTAPDFPVLNMHSHAWPIYTLTKLLGTEFYPDGIRFRPVIPLVEYEFDSPLLGFKKHSGGYSGWYSPATAGHWNVEIYLPDRLESQNWKLLINRIPTKAIFDGQTVRFSGISSVGKPLRWELRNRA